MTKKIDSVDVEFKRRGICIKNGKRLKLCFERVNDDRPLCTIRLTGIIPERLRRGISNKQKQCTVFLASGIATETELIHANKARNPTPQVAQPKICDSDMLVMGCAIYCYRQNSRSYFTLVIRNKIIRDIKKKEIKIAFARNKKGNFYLVPSECGRELNYYLSPKGLSNGYFPLPWDALSSEEKKILREKRCISYKLFLSAKSFGLKQHSYFHNEEERELARFLMEEGIGLSIPRVRYREADIILLPSSAQIEVTTIRERPGGQQKNGAHTGGVHINARVCEGYLRVKERKTPLYFLVCREEWRGHKWLKDLESQVKNEVVILPTDFKTGWGVSIASRIKKFSQARGLL